MCAEILIVTGTVCTWTVCVTGATHTLHGSPAKRIVILCPCWSTLGLGRESDENSPRPHSCYLSEQRLNTLLIGCQGPCVSTALILYLIQALLRLEQPFLPVSYLREKQMTPFPVPEPAFAKNKAGIRLPRKAALRLHNLGADFALPALLYPLSSITSSLTHPIPDLSPICKVSI